MDPSSFKHESGVTLTGAWHREMVEALDAYERGDGRKSAAQQRFAEEEAARANTSISGIARAYRAKMQKKV